MAKVNFHFTGTKNFPTVRVISLPSCGETMVLNIDVLGGDSTSMFFDNEDALYDFVNGIQTALASYLQDDSNIPDPVNGVDDSVRLDG